MKNGLMLIVVGLAMGASAVGCSTPTRTVTANEFTELHARPQTDKERYVYQGSRDGYHYMDHYEKSGLRGSVTSTRGAVTGTITWTITRSPGSVA